MKKESIVAAERELESAKESWRDVQTAWRKEVQRIWSEYSEIADASVTKTLADGVPAWTSFVNNADLAQGISEVRRAWSRFLMHANRVFSKLEQGSKVGSSQPWYGRIINERRTDPLLRYVHQARDADEHGNVILGHDTVIQRTAPKVQVLTAPDPIAFGLPDAGSPIGSILDIPELRLLPAKTRSGTYPPPTIHQGQSINPSIAPVAEATIAYLAQVIADAKLRAV
jgi:hypothetical protein